MKRILICFIALLTICNFANGQQIYQSTEVETAAAPGGGESLFNHFIASNLRLPIKSSFKGLKGRVFVNAVVETDGSMSNLSVLRGMDDLCNQEAIRVVSLYKAWKPATIKNAAVRQAVVLPVVFKSDPVENYDSTLGCLVTYFDKKWVITTVADQQKNRRTIPVDDFGFINGDVLFEKKDGEEWSMVKRVPLKKEAFWKQINEGGKKDSIRAIDISASDQQWNSVYQILQRDEKGMLLDYDEFSNDNKLVLNKAYFTNGALREMIIYKEGKTLFNNLSGNLFEKAECQTQAKLTAWCLTRVRYSKIVFFLCNIYQVKEDVFERLFCAGSMHQSTPIHAHLERFLDSTLSMDV